MRAVLSVAIAPGFREMSCGVLLRLKPVLGWDMDRATIELHLASAEEHVALGIDNVECQREIILQLELDGHDTVEAQRLLVYFEEQLAMHVADRDRLRRELEGTAWVTSAKLADQTDPISRSTCAQREQLGSKR